MAVVVKGKRPLIDRVISKLKRARPQKDDDGMFDVTRTSNEIMSSVKYVIKTGLASFDDMTGGLPFGRVVEFYGLDTSGKTGMAIRAAIRAQQRHIYERITDPNIDAQNHAQVVDGQEPPVEVQNLAYRRIEDDADVTILYIDNEGSLAEDDKLWLTDEYNVDKPTRLDCIDGAADTIMQVFKMMDRTLDALVEEERESKRPQFLVVVVDTIASTSTAEESKSEWGNVDYQRQPKQLREGFRRMIRAINRHNVCMICVNQVSEKYQQKIKKNGKKMVFSTPQDEDFATFGGRALRYYATIRIFFYSIGQIKLTPKMFPDGLLIGFKTTKNRIVKPLREGRLALIFDKGYRDSYSKLETLLFMKFAGYGTAGKIFFRFKANDIPLTTFESVLDKSGDGDDGEDRSQPEISSRSEWPSFYQAHKADFEVMWDKLVERAFSTENTSMIQVDVIDEDESVSGED